MRHQIFHHIKQAAAAAVAAAIAVAADAAIVVSCSHSYSFSKQSSNYRQIIYCFELFANYQHQHIFHCGCYFFARDMFFGTRGHVTWSVNRMIGAGSQTRSTRSWLVEGWHVTTSWNVNVLCTVWIKQERMLYIQVIMPHWFRLKILNISHC